jgi:hypothetical protein
MPEVTTSKTRPRRIYIHGDKLADAPQAFYCSFWDTFMPADHFEQTFSLEQHRDRFREGLRDYKWGVKQRKNVFRPDEFSEVQQPWATCLALLGKLPGTRRRP